MGCSLADEEIALCAPLLPSPVNSVFVQWDFFFFFFSPREVLLSGGTKEYYEYALQHGQNTPAGGASY